MDNTRPYAAPFHALSMRNWLFLTLLCSTVPLMRTSALAHEEVLCEGPLQQDSLRYPETRIVPRIVRDLVAVPASVVAWDEKDWARFSAFAVPTVAMMWPASPSIDTQIERALPPIRNQPGDRAFLKIDTIPMAMALLGAGGLLFGTAWLTKNDRLFEYGTLSLETLAVVQFWHVTAKLLLGREGPYSDARANGDYHGLTRISFPGGTPSGHAATTYAMLAVAAEYWDRAPLYVLAHAVGLYASLSLVYHQQHFVSDVIWGAGMGYFAARWVVRHRSSRYRCRKKDLAWHDRVLMLPVAGGGNFGLTFSVFL